MATQEQGLVVAKESVTLRNPADWLKWLFLRKDTASRNNLWPYVNPDLARSELLSLKTEEPKELDLRRLRDPAPTELLEIYDLTPTELSKYNAWARTYDQKRVEWRQKEKALKEFNSEIARTIDIKHIDLIIDCEDAYERLSTLKKHLCPSVSERNHQLRAQYRSLQTRPRSTNLDFWLDKWVTTTRLLAQAKMADVDGNRA
jgi:hypothetical protein